MAVRCQSGDKVYFHFSGHGQPIVDENKDEDGEFDESMIPLMLTEQVIQQRMENTRVKII